MDDFMRDVLSRAARTFWQAMLAYLMADATVLQEALVDWTRGRHVLLTLFIGGAAAGLSAVYNALICPWLEGARYGE